MPEWKTSRRKGILVNNISSVKERTKKRKERKRKVFFNEYNHYPFMNGHS